VSGRQLTACAIAYFLDSPNPSSNIYLSLDTQGCQLNYIFPQFSLNDTGTIEATVDSVHYYVVQPAP
jgi:hypothetical protein